MADRFRKFIPYHDTISQKSFFAARNQEAGKKGGKKVIGEMVKTESQKVSEDKEKRSTLEAEIR